MPDPLHYRVECAMCSGTLEAESDSIKELFDIAIAHAHSYMKIHSEENKKRIDAARKERKRMKTQTDEEEFSEEADYSNDIRNSPKPGEPGQYKKIYESTLFRWGILGMFPFDKGRKRAESEIDALVK